jgi:hypothetical protein
MVDWILWKAKIRRIFIQANIYWLKEKEEFRNFNLLAWRPLPSETRVFFENYLL